MAIDKEKLLAGRKAVDDYREAHVKLHSEHPEGNVSEEHTPLLEKMLLELKALGFESQDAFRDFNGLSCGREMLRCYKLEGTCDGCVGRERGCYPGCIEESSYFSSKSKTLDREKSTRENRANIDKELSSGTLTLDKIKGPARTYFCSWRKFPGNVPPNCSIRYVKVAEPQFDIYWGIRIPAIEPEQYERDKELWGR